MNIRPSDRARIEREAKAAAINGDSLDHSCPYPFDSVEGEHFKAVYLVALPPNMALPRRIPISAANTTCPELQDTHHRAGSSAQREIPSRWGSELRYRDGTVTDLRGTVLRRRA